MARKKTKKKTAVRTSARRAAKKSPARKKTSRKTASRGTARKKTKKKTASTKKSAKGRAATKRQSAPVAKRGKSSSSGAKRSAARAAASPTPFCSFCWFELNTRNVDGVKRFYGELCGWTTTPSQFGQGVYHHWEKDGVMFGGIMDTNSPEWGDVPSHWMSYITVEDVDSKAEEVQALGGNVCVPPTDIPTVGRFSVVSDSTGGTFSLITLDDPKPLAPVIVWNELMTREAAKARGFYERLLGWTMDTMPMGDMDYIICNNNGQGLAGIFQMSGPRFEHVPTHWLNYIGTQRVDADAARVPKLGGTVIVPPTDIPGNIGRFCVITDPGGAHIALYQSMRS